jgi:tetratricopeptide (TPR) repeat protein
VILVEQADSDLGPLARTLGDLLAGHRAAAGLTQRELARVVGYARASVAGAETGSRVPAQAFWHRCDGILAAGGDLIRAYSQLAVARGARKKAAVARAQADRAARMTVGPLASQVAVVLSGPAEAEHFDNGALSVIDAGGVDALLATTRQFGISSDDSSNRASDRAVGLSDVARIEALTVLWRAADYRIGGGALSAGADHFADAAASLLRGSYSQTTGLALNAGDLAFAARVRYSQARQLQHLHWNEDALATLRLAREQTSQAASPGLLSMLWGAEAASHAALGDFVEAKNALARAHELFGHIELENEPSWMHFFGEGELFAQYGRVYRDMARLDSRRFGAVAVEWVNKALPSFDPSHNRSYTLNLVGLSSAYLLADDTERGLQTARATLERASSLSSRRVWDRIGYLRRDFARHQISLPEVRELDHDMRLSRGTVAIRGE